MKKFNLDTIISKFKNRDSTEDQETQILSAKHFVVAIILCLLAAWTQLTSAAEPVQKGRSSVTSLDTFIPDGESLVPIKVSNYESLDQIIGQYGVVDLLSTPLAPGEKAKRVAYAVKLIRSPKSSHHFSVLIPADKAHTLAGYHGEFTVVVRNPKSLGTRFVKNKVKKPRRQIVYETEKL